jgi:membrane protein implicated in regulation of membrane protease activity
MSFYGKSKEYIWEFGGAIIVILIVIVLALFLPLKLFPELIYLEILGTQQLYLSVAAFLVIFVTLLLTMRKFRKSMAKPKLRVAFSKERATGVEIDIRRDKSDDYNLYLLITNDGNAVTRLFQIDFEIPDIFDPKLKASIGGRFLPYETIRSSSNGDASKDTRIISFYNDWDFCVFVNSPVEFLTLSLKSLPQNYEDYEQEYEIRYRVYGDWAETQEGKLKVICKKK